MESFEVLDMVSIGPGFERSYYRIRTASSTIKYLALVSQHPTFPDFRGEQLDFSTVPEGDWNLGHLVPKVDTQKATLGTTETTTLATIGKNWHPCMIDYADLGEASSGLDELQCRHQIYSAVYRGHSGADKVIVSFEWHPETIYGVDHETEIYSLIHGHDIGPKFLAHITENRERVIGYIVSRLAGRPATPGDLQACREVLSKLHGLGIVYGQLKPSSFIIENGRALLHSFAGSYHTNDKNKLDAEMASLEDALQIDQQPDKPVSQELSDELHSICERDGGIHPAVLYTAVREGKIDITKEEHEGLLFNLQRDGGLWKPSD